MLLAAEAFAQIVPSGGGANGGAGSLTCKGTATLSNGSVTVSNGCITSGGNIEATGQQADPNVISTINQGSGTVTFVSSSALDNSTFSWVQG